MIYLSTQKGIGKVEGEDAVLVGQELFAETTATLPTPEKGFICLADGVGGHNGGRTASHNILAFLRDSGFCGGDLKDLLYRANDNLKEAASKSPELKEMATTLSGIWYSGENCYLLHIGNTRVYARQGRYLKQLTSDHTLYKWLMSMGRTEEAESCNRNVIVGCLGGNREDLITHLCVAELGKGGTYLLTSDGVHEYLTIDYLEDVLSNEMDDLQKCTTIIDAARDAGSTDDLSVVLICKEDQDGI